MNDSGKTQTVKKKRLRFFLAAGLVAAGLLCAYLYFFVHRPIGQGPAGPAVPAEPFAQVWSERDVVLLGLGDSVTAGFGASPGLSYMERLLRNPDGEFSDMNGKCLEAVLPNIRQRNASVSGSTSIDHIDKHLPELSEESADTFGIVVLTTGGNDLIHMYGRVPPVEGAMYGATVSQAEPWIENFETRLDDMIDQIEGLFPGGCRIFLANIYDPSDGIGDCENAGLPRWDEMLPILEAYNNVIASCAEKNESVHLVDFYSEFLGHGIHCTQFWRENYRPDDPHYWYFINLEDPNDRGYDAIRRLFLIEMAKVLPPVLPQDN